MIRLLFIGGAIYFLFLRGRGKSEKMVRIKLPTITLPDVGRGNAERVAEEVRPDISLSLTPPGWKLTFRPYTLGWGWGSFTTPVPDPIVLPLIPKWYMIKLYYQLRQVKVSEVETATGRKWVIQFPTIEIPQSVVDKAKKEVLH